ncbi:iron complex outermembrane receptor protein [Chitinophaga japonensis]|uniref:Iron complex outermembrane receptor protein n=2 Tax=Chitinophaga japonensis TaxID=104662 RepID=A0A562STF9_CHIJA|nr:iron complex outermembrane receptor protein [Chitinophaga japonensis]
MAQSVRLAGRVLDHTQAPARGATVAVYPAAKTAVTDTAGYFSFADLPRGRQQITVTFTGHHQAMLEVNLRKHLNKVADITLIPFTRVLGEVVVSDNYAGRNRRESSLQIEAVNSDYIRRNLGGSLMQSLERLPGVKTIGIGSGNSKPLIRGLGFNQVVVVDNGIKHEGQQWGADHGLEIDQFAVNRLEIIKGPASFVYGSDAIAGAIDIKPAPPPSQDTLGGAFDLAGRSNNNQYGGSLQLYGRKGAFFFDTRLTHTAYGDYRVPADTVYVYSYAVGLNNRYVRNTAGREWNLHASAGWMGSRMQSVFYLSRVYNKTGFFANAHGLEPRRVDAALHDRSNRDMLMPNQEVTHHKIINRSVFRPGRHRLETELGFQRNFRQEWNQYVNHGYMPPVYPGHMQVPSTLERQYDKRVYSLNIQDEITLGRHALTFGANGEYQRNRIDGWSFLIPSFDQVTAGAFVYDKLRLNDALFLHGAARYDYGRIDMKEYTDWFSSDIVSNGDTVRQYLQRAGNLTRMFNSVNWSAGVNFTPGAFTLKANIGSSFRMPIAKELGANGVNYHYFRYEKGDPGLSPERSYQLDLGLGWTATGWSVELSPFFNYFPNYIYLNPTSQHDYYYGAGNQVFHYAQSRVMRYGGEAQVRYRFLEHWSAEILGEYLYNEQLSGEKKGYTLPFTPPPSLLLNVSYHPVFRKTLHESYVSLDYRLTAKQDNIVPPERKTPGYRVLNFSAGSRVRLKRHDLTIHLLVQNVLNTRYLRHTSFYRLIQLPEPGRNIILSVKIPFSVSING